MSAESVAVSGRNRAQRRAANRAEQTREGESLRYTARKRGGVVENIVVDGAGKTKRRTQYPKRGSEPHDKRTARARRTRKARREAERLNDQWQVAYRMHNEDFWIPGRVTARSLDWAKRAAMKLRPIGTREFRVLPYCEVA